MIYFGGRGRIDGDVINIYFLYDIWIDYCYFVNGVDGLVDVIMGFIGVMIFNNYFIDYDKVILLGVYLRDMFDMYMCVIVVYNYFGFRFIEWLLRYFLCVLFGFEIGYVCNYVVCFVIVLVVVMKYRFCRICYGCVYVLNNMYEGWGMYVIGGSEGLIIVS